MWSVAQFIESRRHRKTLQKFMADIFAAPGRTEPARPVPGRPAVPLVVNSWYDDEFATALRAAGRDDFVEIQGITRAGINFDAWTLAYDAARRALRRKRGRGGAHGALLAAWRRAPGARTSWSPIPTMSRS